LCSPARSPRIGFDLDSDSIFLCAIFGKTCPSDFRIGKDHCGDRLFVEHNISPKNHFDGYLGFVAGFVSQHRFSGDIADGQDVRVCRSLLAIAYCEPAFVDLYQGVLKPNTATCRSTTDAY
jgi:hypothetical protein